MSRETFSGGGRERKTGKGNNKGPCCKVSCLGAQLVTAAYCRRLGEIAGKGNKGTDVASVAGGKRAGVCNVVPRCLWLVVRGKQLGNTKKRVSESNEGIWALNVDPTTISTALLCIYLHQYCISSKSS